MPRMTSAWPPALAGAGAGGLGGGLIGVIGAGIPEDRARQYETDLNAGGILIGVTARGNDSGAIERVLRSEGAAEVQSR